MHKVLGKSAGWKPDVVLAAGVFLASVMVGCSNGGPSASTQLARSQRQAPIVHDGRVEKAGDNEVLHLAVTYPDVAARSEQATVTAHVYSDARKTQVVGTADKTGPVHGTVKYDLPLSGSAASTLAASTDPLSLVSVQVDSKRDLHGSSAPDHEWIVTDAGAELARTQAAASAPSSSTVPSSSSTSPSSTPAGPGGLQGAHATLHIRNHANAPVYVDLAPATCMNDASATVHHAFVQNGDGEGLSVRVEDDEGLFDDVLQHLGIGQSGAAASTMYSPDVRQFGYEMANWYASGLAVNIPNYGDFLKGEMPKGGVCVANVSTFVLGVEEMGAYNSAYGHLARVLKQDRGTIKDFEPLTQTHLNYGIDEGSSTTIAVSQGGSAPPSCTANVEGWMGCAYATGSSQADTPLSDMVWPGTHDSATSELGSTVEYLNTDTSRNTSCSSFHPEYQAVPTAVYDWAVTQRSNLRGQLDRGVRYFDLRTSWLPGQPQAPRFGHTMSSQSTIDLDLHAVADWAHAHPQEVVIVNFSAICGKYGDLNSFANAVTSPDPLTNPPVSLCSQSYRGDRPYASNVGAQTINEIRRAPLAPGATGNNVIVLLDDDLFGAGAPLQQQCGFVPRWSGDGHAAPGEAGFSSSYVPMAAPGAGPTGECTLKDFPTKGHNVDQGDNGYFESYFTGDAANPSLQTFRNVYPTGLYVAPINYELPNTDCAISLIARQEFGVNRYGGLIDWDQGLEPNTKYTVHPTRQEIIQAWGRKANIVESDVLTDEYVPTIVGLDQSAPPPRPVDKKGTSLYVCGPDGGDNTLRQYTIDPGGVPVPKQDPGPSVRATCAGTMALAGTSDGKYLYEVRSGGLVGWAAGSSGQLVPMDPWPPQPIGDLAGLAVTPDNKLLLAASATQLQPFSIGSDGRLTPGATVPLFSGVVTSAAPSQPDPVVLTVDPDGRRVEVARSNNGAGLLQSVNIGSGGSLQPAGTPMQLGQRPVALAMTPDGQSLYVGDTGAGAIQHLTRSGDGTWAVGASTNLPTPNVLLVSRDGRALYAGDGAGHVYTYTIGAGGTLTSAGGAALQEPPLYGSLTPDGTGLYMTGATGKLSMFAVGKDGTLSPLSPPSQDVGPTGGLLTRARS